MRYHNNTFYDYETKMAHKFSIKNFKIENHEIYIPNETYSEWSISTELSNETETEGIMIEENGEKFVVKVDPRGIYTIVEPIEFDDSLLKSSHKLFNKVVDNKSVIKPTHELKILEDLTTKYSLREMIEVNLKEFSRKALKVKKA